MVSPNKVSVFKGTIKASMVVSPESSCVDKDGSQMHCQSNGDLIQFFLKKVK
jgi:hypothetical protein